MSRLWLTDARSDEVCLYETDSGDHRRFAGRTHPEPTSGTIHRFWRSRVAVYLDEDDHGVVLQVGSTRCLLDGTATARVRSRFGGLVTVVSIERDGSSVVTVTQAGTATAAVGIAALANDVVAREAFRRTARRGAGPGVCWVVHGG
jgi:hypothetical protein